MSLTTHKPEHLTGIVEAGETFFIESHKGEVGLSRPPRKWGARLSHKNFTCLSIDSRLTIESDKFSIAA